MRTIVGLLGAFLLTTQATARDWNPQLRDLLTCAAAGGQVMDKKADPGMVYVVCKKQVDAYLQWLKSTGELSDSEAEIMAGGVALGGLMGSYIVRDLK